MTPEAQDCEERVRELYGGSLERDAGILHVLALWKSPEGPPRIIQIGRDAPESDTDRFILHLARARSDVVVTSGSVLRAEPGVTHEIGSNEAMRNELMAWRGEVLGRHAPPQSVVFSRGENLDLDHPLLLSPGSRILYTGETAASRLRTEAEARGIRVVGRPTPSLRDALVWLRKTLDARTIGLEIGARASAPLYEEPLGVDELLLSLYEEPDLPKNGQGAAFFELDWLARHLEATAPAVVRREASGSWSFHRLRRTKT